jgi:hypothetical protein
MEYAIVGKDLLEEHVKKKIVLIIVVIMESAKEIINANVILVGTEKIAL